MMISVIHILFLWGEFLLQIQFKGCMQL